MTYARFMFRLAMLLAGISLLGGGVAEAHGPQIQLTGDTGKLITREILLDEPYGDSLTAPKSVYVMPVLPYLGVWYSRPNVEPDALDPNLPHFYSGPGYAYGYDRNGGGAQLFPAGSNFSIAFTTGLRRWDGATFVDAGAVELEAFAGSLATRTADNAASPAFPFPAAGLTTYTTDAHNTVRYRFLGDGISTAAEPADGIYLASLQLSTTAAGITGSDPYQFVLYKGAGLGDVSAAVNSLGVDSALVQFVPEPTVFGGLVLGCLILFRRAWQLT